MLFKRLKGSVRDIKAAAALGELIDRTPQEKIDQFIVGLFFP